MVEKHLRMLKQSAFHRPLLGNLIVNFGVKKKKELESSKGILSHLSFANVRLSISINLYIPILFRHHHKKKMAYLEKCNVAIFGVFGL